ncbi:patatin-like phospholipase family protein [Persicobacter diffluens]|uniref:PNPLA domain-containing protein n=1 Tax=Persicobacter diffluens TaxID=981 RepID=A0AAN4VVG8_9BACT|nr:hypothetical protein PEDI_14210 [Persicobacter diffluens]
MKAYSINLDQKKIGACFSGGGVKGVAHLGMIKAFEEVGVQFSAVSGTSSGAIVAAFYAAGYPAEELLGIIKSLSLTKLVRPAWSKKGLLNIEQLKPLFYKYLAVDKFEELSIPLTVAAIDLVDGQICYFDTGDLILPLMASCAIPAIFAPVPIDGKMLIDGGMLNNMPVEALVGRMDVTVGFNCNVIQKGCTDFSLKKNLERSLLLAVNVNVQHSQRYCDWYLEAPQLAGYSPLKLEGLDDIFEIGYRYAKDFLRQQELNA